MYNSNSVCKEPIYSEFANDEMMAELVVMFVEELPIRIDVIENSLAVQDMELLNRTAHQMKGAFGSYGFHELTTPARNLESATSKQDCNLDSIRREVEILVSMIRRITSSAAPN